ncbi:MAG: FumA C-terminus/TtdB family hydratase beta subunit [Pseudomonadota bacterium]
MLDCDGITTAPFQGRDMVIVPEHALQRLAYQAFVDTNHFLRTSHLTQLRAIFDDEEASPNDKFVALELLKNANIAASGTFPMCQDTGTAIIMGKKGRNIWTEQDDRIALSRGVYEAYQQHNLRFSQVAPLSLFTEQNTKTNLPAQIEIYQEGKDDCYEFLFIAKGGGSANKAFLHQSTPATLEESRMLEFFQHALEDLGTSACPPYHLAVVIGGPSAEFCMKTMKLASCGYLDDLPEHGSGLGHAMRDRTMEEKLLEMTRGIGIGAQFGGKYFCHDVRVLRLPRHGASLPIAVGVSCSADRQILGCISAEGVALELLEREPARFMPDVRDDKLSGQPVTIDLDRPMHEVLQQLQECPVKTRLSLNGTLIVARDSAHRRIRENIAKGKPIPDYFKNHPIYYAGPAKTPDGYVSGSFGPTTAGRMDSFVDEFQALGGSLVMLAKGNRSPAVRKACKKHGGFYLGSVGGPAARLGRDCITKVECIDFEDLGMEAIWRISIKDFPAFVVIDDKGNDFFVLTREKKQRQRR